MAGLANLTVRKAPGASRDIATVLNQSRGVQIVKNVGDHIQYKPTIRNSGSTTVRARIHAQLGNQANVVWQPLATSEGYKTVDLPPGDTVVTLDSNIPANAVAAGDSYTYDCRVEIQDPGTLQRVDYWDSYDEVKVNGAAIAAVGDLSVVGISYA